MIDWALALRLLTEQETETLNDIKNDTQWGIVADTLTTIANHQLGLPHECFHKEETIPEEQEQRVWDDIIKASRTPQSNSSNFRRLYIAKRMLKNSWKFKEYSNIR